MNEKHLPELEPCRSCEYLKYKQLEGDNIAILKMILKGHIFLALIIANKSNIIIKE